MKLDHLQLFLDVCRNGSFAMTARQHDCDPSSVSRGIADLEDQLKTRLFHRTTRRLTPTLEGAALRDRLTPLMEEMGAALAPLTGREASGTLRVTASSAFAEHWLVPRLATFCQSWPEVMIDLVVSDQPRELVGEGIDIALRHGALNSRAMADSSFVARKLMDVRYKAVVASKSGALDDPAMLAMCDCITFPYDGFGPPWHFFRAGREQKVDFTPVMRLSSAGVMLRSVRERLGYALLPDWLVREDLARDTIVEALPGWSVRGTAFDSAIWIVLPSRAQVPARVKVFTQFLTEQAASTVDRRAAKR